MNTSELLKQIYQTLNKLDTAIPVQAMSKINTAGVAQSLTCLLPAAKG